MELAEFFEPDMLPLVQKLAGRPNERFPTWQTLVNHALGRRTADTDSPSPTAESHP